MEIIRNPVVYASMENQECHEIILKPVVHVSMASQECHGSRTKPCCACVPWQARSAMGLVPKPVVHSVVHIRRRHSKIAP